MHAVLVVLAVVGLVAVVGAGLVALLGPAYYALFRAQRDATRQLPPDRRRRFIRNELRLAIAGVATVAAALILYVLLR